MSKQDILADGINQGLHMALRLAEEAEERGARVSDVLASEIRYRGATGIRICMSKAEIKKASENIARMNAELDAGITLFTLWQDFGFGKKRLNHFVKERDVNLKALGEGSINWKEVLDVLKERGAEFDFESAILVESLDGLKEIENG